MQIIAHKSRCLILIIFLTIISLPAEAASSVGGLRILQLNFNSEATLGSLKDRRYENLKEYTAQNDIDLLLVQECWQYQNYNNFATKFAAEMNMDLVAHFENGVEGIFVTSISIIAKKLLNMRNPHAYKLPHSAITIGNGVDIWIGLGEVDMLIGATITLPNGQPALVWNNHLNNSTSQNRLDQVKFALSKMQVAAQKDLGQNWAKATVIYGGDFNSDPSSPEGQYVSKVDGFRDLWIISHPNDVGLTEVSDITNPEYNPVVHGAGQIPSQTDDQGTERMDYIHFRSPTNCATTVGRVFTSPLNHAWMSDHFGLLAEINCSGGTPTPLPEADTDISLIPKTTIFSLTNENLYKLPSRQDYDISAERGFTIQNSAYAGIDFEFTKNTGNVYTEPTGYLNPGDESSFAFFLPGDYPYVMHVTRQDVDSSEQFIHGVMHVHNYIK